jgi:hypothetical protein
MTSGRPSHCDSGRVQPPVADPPAAPGADQGEGRVLRVDRDGLLVDWGGRLGTVRRT